MSGSLPQCVSGRLREVLIELGEEGRAAFLPHLVGGTPATYLSEWLNRVGYQVSVTTIKEQRQKVRAA